MVSKIRLKGPQEQEFTFELDFPFLVDPIKRLDSDDERFRTPVEDDETE